MTIKFRDRLYCESKVICLKCLNTHFNFSFINKRRHIQMLNAKFRTIDIRTIKQYNQSFLFKIYLYKIILHKTLVASSWELGTCKTLQTMVKLHNRSDEKNDVLSGRTIWILLLFCNNFNNSAQEAHNENYILRIVSSQLILQRKIIQCNWQTRSLSE